MKGFKKVFSFIVVVLMLVSLFASCKSKTDEPKEKDVTQEKPITEKVEISLVEEKEGPSWTWDTAPIEVDWFIDQNWFNVIWDEKNTLVHKTITEMTGVKINFIVPSGDAQQRLNTMIAAGDYPDIITVTGSLPQVNRLVESGKVYPLMELADQYAPSFKDILPDSMVNWYTQTDGNWYGIPNFFDAPEYAYEGQELTSHAGFVAREDIMQKLGINPEEFNTQEGTLNALRKVRDADFGNNGQKIIPLLLPAQGGLEGDMFLYESLLPGFFAIPVEDQQGNLINIRKDPKYLEGLKFLNTCYREGLLSIENFTMQKQQINEKMVTGNGFAYLGALGDAKGFVQELYNDDNSKILKPYGPIRANDNATPTLFASGGNGWTLTMITKNAKHPDRIIRLFELMYSEEGSLLGHWGVEGVTYQVREDGKFEYTPEYKALREENSEKAKVDYGLESLYWVHNWQQIVGKMPKGTEGAALLDDILWNYYPEWSYDGRALSNVQPEAESDVAIKKIEIDGYILEQMPKIILAASEEECIANYNKMINQLDILGQQEVLDAMNVKFKENKAKLNIKYMWPGYGSN